MLEYRFSLVRVFQYKDRIEVISSHRKIRVREKPFSDIFNAVISESVNEDQWNLHHIKTWYNDWFKLTTLAEKSLQSKHLSWWRRTEDVMKTSSRRLQCNIFLSYKTFWRRPQDVFKTLLQGVFLEKSWSHLDERFFQTRPEHVLKTSWRRLMKASWRRLWRTPYKYILKTSWRRLGRRNNVMLKTSSRRLEDVWKTRNVCWVFTNVSKRPLILHIFMAIISVLRFIATLQQLLFDVIV